MFYGLRSVWPRKTPIFEKTRWKEAANGSKNRPHDAYPVRCRVPGHYEACSERVWVCQLKKCRQRNQLGRHLFDGGATQRPGDFALREGREGDGRDVFELHHFQLEILVSGRAFWD